MNDDQAVKLIAVLKAAYPTHPVSEDTVTLYVEVFTASLPRADIAAEAVAAWTKTQTWWPKVNELVEAYQRTARARVAPVSGECDRCHGHFWEDVDPTKGFDPDPAAIKGVLPCSRCHPQTRRHYDENHAGQQLSEKCHRCNPEMAR